MGIYILLGSSISTSWRSFLYLKTCQLYWSWHSDWRQNRFCLMISKITTKQLYLQLL